LGKKSNQPLNQLPLICKKCGGPIQIVQVDDAVISRCLGCEESAIVLTLLGTDELSLHRIEREQLEQVADSARALYEYIRRYHRKYGFVPSRRDMKNAMGWGSLNSVRHQLGQLQEAGLIELTYAASRGIKLLHAA
jgi:hypothetical protein